MIRILKNIGFVGAAVAVAFATSAAAQDEWRTNYTIFGTPGIIDMPSAVAAAEGELAGTIAVFGDTQRATFTFQLLPRLTGSYRYSLIDTYDRSFDVQYQISNEGRYSPAFSIGLRDFLGTGRYSSEYIVATKTLGSNVRVTGGLGWGRLGSLNGFTNPLGIIDGRFETRPNSSVSTGGTVLAGQFFRGDAAFFGGVEWRINDQWTALAEYSSDTYDRETTLIGFDRQSPLNFGLKYQRSERYQFGAYYMYGTDIGLSATVILDPMLAKFPSGLETTPVPVAVRGANAAAAASWPTQQSQAAGVEQLGTLMGARSFRLIGAEVTGNTMRVRFENNDFRSEAQAVGRVARLMTQVAPANVETFVIEPTRRGIALSAVTLRRSDLEALENEPNASALSYDRAGFSDAAGPAPAIAFEDPTPAFFLWGISPYLELSLFDGDKPVRGDLGIEASFQYELRSNVVLAGAFRQRLAGNRNEVGSISPSSLPDVRRTGLRYGADTGNGIENLYLTWYGRPGTDLYSRVSAGYLERNFGGVSGELLWKPVDSQLAVGAEINYTMLRDYDLGLGFRPRCIDLNCTVFANEDYDVVTGHLSAYYDFENGFQAQVDVGRYLAGDWGATFSLDREFDNGWKVGAYFTLTDVPFDDFGEGSFDKGIRIEIPSDWLLGNQTRDAASTSLASLSRDGGARLRIDGRLYDVIEDGHQGMMEENWGRFWR